MTVKEIDFQLQVVKAVRAAGGEATKLSNRFLIGVCDLLVKLPPPYPAMLIEVKKDDYPVRTREVRPDVTVKQHQFLNSYWDAGATCGVLSFLVDRRAKRRHGALVSLRELRRLPLELDVDDYRELGRGDVFGSSVVELIKTLR